MTGTFRLPPERSGVYAPPVRPAELFPIASATGVLCHEIGLAATESKRELLAAFAAALEFPPEFGANWDALADSLQDFSWRPAAARLLWLRNARTARERLGADWDTLVEILRESAMYWKARGKSFVVWVDDAQGLPAWT